MTEVAEQPAAGPGPIEQRDDEYAARRKAASVLLHGAERVRQVVHDLVQHHGIGRLVGHEESTSAQRNRVCASDLGDASAIARLEVSMPR